MMEKLKFKGTPMPWEPVYISGICIGIRKKHQAGYSQMVLNTILPETDEAYEREKEEIEANVHLAAVAPELLAALGNFLTIIECNPELLESPCFKAAHDYANEVIKKALEG